MKLRNRKEYEHVEPVKKYKKILNKNLKKQQIQRKDLNEKEANEKKRELRKKIAQSETPSQKDPVRYEKDRRNSLNFVRAYAIEIDRMSTDGLKPIEDLSFEGNISENWRLFKRDFDIIYAARGIDKKTEPVKVGTFLNAIGRNALEVYESFKLSDEEKGSYTAIVKAFDDFCTPRKNIVFERYKFGLRNQKEGEPFDVFLIEIKKLAKNCAFKEEDDMIRDRIVIGITDSNLRARLLETSDLTMAKAIEKARASETSREQNESMSRTAAVNEISSTHNSTHGSKPTAQSKNNSWKDKGNKKGTQTQQSTHQQQQHQRQRNTGNNSNDKSNATQNSSVKEIKNCNRCGRTHKIRQCPAYGKNCNNCSKPNHYSKMCRQRNVATIDMQHDSSDSDELYIGTIDCPSEISDSITFPWIEQIQMNEKNVNAKIDTGAETDVLPLNVLKKIAPTAVLQTTSVKLRAFGGQRLKPLGMCSLLSSYNGISLKINYAIVDLDFIPILGLKTCVRFGIVQPSRVNKNKRNKNKQL